MNLIKIINSLKCLILIIFIQIVCTHGFPKNPVASNEIHDNKNNVAINMGNRSCTQLENLNCQIVSRILTVKINRKLKPFQQVAVTGNMNELGHWKVNNAKILTQMEVQDNFEIWSGKIKTLINHTIEYRYFVARRDHSQIHVDEWETHMQPRILIDDNVTDEYGVINDTYNTDKGWLSGETIVQLKFYRNPFNCSRLNQKSHIGIKIIPMLSDSLNTIDNIGFTAVKEDEVQNENVKVEVTKFIYNDSQLVSQSDEGVVYTHDDIVIFHITVKNLNEIGYLVYLSTVDSQGMKMQLGYQAILPSELKGSDGALNMPIISQTELKPIGFMKIRYLIINSYPKAKHLSLRTSFARYWDPTWINLDIGHRGLGTSFNYLPKHQPPTIENTIAGFKQSIQYGADVVEFDVQLTKDLIPIIYHNFYVHVFFKPGRPSQIDELINLPINDLTYSQLKNLKTYHVVNNSIIFEYPSHNEEDRPDYRLFPTLQEVFREVDKSIGFDIEIKWPQPFLNGDDEGKQTIDKNRFVNEILLTILEKGGCGRFIYMSSFDADICTMIKFKQNIFPIMFLIFANKQENSFYEDPRGNTMTNAVCNVQAFNMLGVVGHTGNFISDSSQVQLGTNLKQIVLTYGSDANSTSSIRKLKQTGLQGVIYDRLDLYCEKNESIFNTDKYRKLFKQQCLTIE